MTTIDLAFPVRGKPVPRDHGYALYSGLCRAVPAFHGATWLAVHPLPGSLIEGAADKRRIESRLSLRIPADRITAALPLAGTTLDVAGSDLSLGAPTVSALRPAVALDARLVVLKLTDAPRRTNEELGRATLDKAAFTERYVAELTRQLQHLGISADPELHGRRSIAVAGKRVVGYSVRVQCLDADQSILLQEHGLGGKRRMGCGIFRPTRGR